MKTAIRLELTGDLDHLRICWQTVETWLAAVPFEEDPEQTRYNLLVAVQEVVSNVLRHGYALDQTPWMLLSLSADGDALALELRDRARAFDPTNEGDPPAPAQGEEIAGGGYGIFIVRAVTDGLEYRRDGDENVLTLFKRVAPVHDRT